MIPHIILRIFHCSEKIEKIGKIVKPFKRITEFKMSDVPKPDELDDIWFYINYRLNFYQMFKEKNKERLHQHLIFMEYVHKNSTRQCHCNVFLCLFTIKNIKTY